MTAVELAHALEAAANFGDSLEETQERIALLKAAAEGLRELSHLLEQQGMKIGILKAEVDEWREKYYSAQAGLDSWVE